MNMIDIMGNTKNLEPPVSDIISNVDSISIHPSMDT